MRYPFQALLHIICCAVISGAGTLTTIAEWPEDAAAVMGFPPGTRVPSVATFHQVIARLDAELLDTAELERYVRHHWGIENRLHWIRDVIFKEDSSEIRTGNAAHTMATIRNLAISVHRLAGATSIAQALRTAMRNPGIAQKLIS